MAKNQMANILKSDTREVNKTHSSANGILSSIWRGFLTNVNENKWNMFMHAFLNDPRNGVPQTRKDQTSMRGNLTKEFGRPAMTWKVFCKAMKFRRFRAFTISIIAEEHNGQEVVVSRYVNLGNKDKGNMLDMSDLNEKDSGE